MSDDEETTVPVNKSAIEAIARLAGGNKEYFAQLVARKGGKEKGEPLGRLEVELPERTIEALDHLARVSGRKREEVLANLIGEAVIKSLGG